MDRKQLLKKTNQDRDLAILLDLKEISYNGVAYKNFSLLETEVKAKVEQMSNDFSPCIMHGDFCFSNILFDLNNLIIKLIDPRGSFGVPSIFGDPRYDVAKLRHSAVGLYDFIVSGFFLLEHCNELIKVLSSKMKTFEISQPFLMK